MRRRNHGALAATHFANFLTPIFIDPNVLSHRIEANLFMTLNAKIQFEFDARNENRFWRESL